MVLLCNSKGVVIDICSKFKVRTTYSLQKHELPKQVLIQLLPLTNNPGSWTFEVIVFAFNHLSNA